MVKKQKEHLISNVHVYMYNISDQLEQRCVYQVERWQQIAKDKRIASQASCVVYELELVH